MNIEDYAWSPEYECHESPLLNRNNRTRKVTVTEITEEIEDWEMVTGSDEDEGTTTDTDNEEVSDEESSDGEDAFDDDQDDERAETPSEMIPVDEAFQMLDDMVADWKTKLEAVVGEGLKKLRRNGKDKRTLAKYIPGQQNRITDEAKAAILREWLSEFKSTLAQTSRNLGMLAKENMEEAEAEIMEKLLPKDLAMEQGGVETNVNKNKKTVVNLKFGDDNPQENCLRQLLLDLESVCSLFQGGYEQDLKMATIPAYNPLNGVDNKSVGLDWRQERNSFFQRYFEPLRQTFRKQDTVKDILDNFIIRNYAGCDNKKVVEPLMKMKSTRRLTHLNVAQKKMFERRQDRMRKSKEQIVAEKSNSGKYSLLQVTKDGKERFFIVKKKEKTARDGQEAEEIFAEWHNNLNVPAPLVTLKRPNQKSAKRVSQRFKRRQIIQEADRQNRNVPVLYADMVKKNLKGIYEAEDIFESWVDNLREDDKAYPESKMPDGRQGSDDLDIFKVWRHNLGTREKRATRGSPEPEENILSTALPFRLELSGGGCVTIPVYRSLKLEPLPLAEGKPKRAKIVEPSLMGTETHRGETVKADDFEAEEYFSHWRRNLMAPNVKPEKTIKVRKQQPPMPENVFSDWLGNFKEPASFWMRKDVRRKPLKAAKRQSVLDDLDSLIDKEDQVMQKATAKPNKKKFKCKAKK